MNEREDYFSISKNGHIHTLSDRIPLNWKELMLFSSGSLLFTIWFFGIGIGIFVAILTVIAYTLYRFASWIYYTELIIDEKSGSLTRLKKILDHTKKTELISETFDPNRFEYSELTRSGKTKFLMSYRTHKNNELLILRNKSDKEQIEQYIAEKITEYNRL